MSGLQRTTSERNILEMGKCQEGVFPNSRLLLEDLKIVLKH